MTHDTADNKKKFIEVYRSPESGANITTVCEVTGIARPTYYMWLEKDEEFRKAMFDLKWERCDEAEQALYHRGLEKSDAALIFWLKYNHPTYREGPNTLTQINAEKIIVGPMSLDE